MAIAYEHGDFAGWHAILGPGRHDVEDLEKTDAKPNDLSSLVVVAGTTEDATAAHQAVRQPNSFAKRLMAA